MSNYNGRRGPNVTAFLQEMHDNPGSLEPTSAVGGFMEDKDLAMFTNTEFFDLELGQHTDYQPQPPPSLKPETEASHSTHSSSPLDMEDPTSAATAGVDDFSIDFMADNYTFPHFGDTFTPPSMNSAFPNLPAIQPQPQPQPMPSYAGPTQPPHGHAYPQPHPQPRSTSSPDSHPDRQNREAEEDKRRRNTAASARFRVKKKQREQALEQSTKEMTAKVNALEGRIQELETENKFLKSIVLEKNGGNEAALKMGDAIKAKVEAVTNAAPSPEAHDLDSETG